MVNEFSSLIYYDEEGRIDYYDYIGAYANSSGVNDWSTTYNVDFRNDGRLDSFSLAADGDITAKTANATVNFTYDKYNRLTNKAYTYTASSSFTASASYTFTETTAATSSQVATYTSTVGTSSVTSTYTYDDNSFITKIVLSTGAEYRYVYDDLGQLKREDNTVTGKTYIYDYDDAGNITSKNTYSIAAAGVTPTSLLSSVTYGYNDEYEWGDLLTSYGNVTITYDEIGNPLSYYNGSSYTFTWKNGRQLATASVNSNTLFFNYNDEGIRTSKTVNGVVHTYHLSGSDIIAEEWGNNLIVYLYDADGSPMGMQYRTSSMAKGLFYTFWFEKNLQGDIIAIYNSSGTKVISYTYDAWGNCTTTYHNVTGTNSYATYNPFRYRGYYYDSELGFYYLNSRYYDPAVGRFINADTLVSTGQGILGYNMFAYCGNNPISFCDPCGTCIHRWDFWNNCDKCSAKTPGEHLYTTFSELTDMVVHSTIEGLIPGFTHFIEATHYNRNLFNKTYSQDELIAMGVEAEPADKSKFHQNNQLDGENKKYVIGNWFSSEIVFYSDGSVNNSPEDCGTFNIYSGNNGFLNVVVHGTFDVIPYMIYGNSKDDSTTIIDRIVMAFK